jgi:predicted lipoprotein with Yx(FWY)xxD motif
MMKHKLSTALLGSGALMLLSGVGAAASSRSADDVPLAVPPGITLVDVSKSGYGARDEFLWRRLGDAQGNPLFTYTLEGHSGKSSCYGDCAKEFPAVLAPSDAVASGDWSLIDRPEGKQWVFQGQPLYSYAGGEVHEQLVDHGDGTERGFGAHADPGGKGFSPKAGWRQAVYDPSSSIHTPADIRLESLEAANGYAFVVAPTGLPIYFLKSEPKDTSQWTPLYASSLALTVGDFSIARRSDGTHQWAYKGQRLYTYNGDYSGTDINGVTQKDARIAMANRFFMPAEFAINVFPTRAPMLTTAKGLAAYTEAPYHLQYGGRETRGGYHYSYAEAKSVGTHGCTAECTRTWRPILAPAGALSSAFWQVVDRPDGSKQWAYKGSALYTYAGDTAPGDIKGNNKAVIIYGTPQDHLSAVMGEGFSPGVGGTDFASGPTKATSVDLMTLAGGKYLDPHANYGGSFGAGFYWHLVPLYN